ncbi:hypothetical protein SDC9_187464 [bioreactor metagenome]|uniref:Uncharacterized protein n=1 Tax=bioreactor metagenome TaxID=1076179 RepID=A0A645HM93_9ZZZZ
MVDGRGDVLDVFQSERCGGEELYVVCARLMRGDDFGRRHCPGNRNETEQFCIANHVQIRVRRNDELAARVFGHVDLIAVEHRARAEPHVRKTGAERGNRVTRAGQTVRIGLVKGDLHERYAALFKRFRQAKKILPVNFTADGDDSGLLNAGNNRFGHVRYLKPL